MKKYIVKAIALASISLMAAGCTDSFDEVNTDPDRPNATLVPSTNILAYCERYASDNMFDEWFDLNETAGFSSQVAKWQYTDEGYYSFRPTVNSSSWAVAYLTCNNLQSILDKEEEGSNAWCAATIFQCQIFQIIFDRWGNAPYSEALKLEQGIVAPAYDEQSAVYPDLLKRLKTAVESLGTYEDAIGSGDVMLGGNIEAWKKYGNALRIRIAARIANIAPDLAKSTIEEVAKSGIYPTSNDDNVFFEAWGSEYSEPYADYWNSRSQEYGVSKLMVETLKGANDPRLAVYCKPTTNFVNGVADAEEYAGYQNGQKAYANISAFSSLGERFVHSDGSGFSPWLRSCETYFALAYAASKGWNVGMTQQAAYEAAVTLSLEENEIEADDIAAYLAAGGKYEGTVDQIFTQWWISLFKNGQEAWSVYRMAPNGSYLFVNNVVAPDSDYPGHNCPPLSYGYPDTERNLNANCKAQADKENDYFWGKQMWWDVRTGLK